MARFTLSWSFPENAGAVLTFDKCAWHLFERTAKRKGLEAEEMIAVAVAQLAGSITKYNLRS